MQSKATTVEAYLNELPADRREALTALREVFRRNIGKGYEEGMSYGMMGYCVPHSIYPAGYHCDPSKGLPFAGMASQKNYMSLYLMSLYGPDSDEAWFRDAWAATGKKLDMGKSCIRFKRLDDLALDVIAEAIRRVPVERWIAYYESTFKPGTRKPTASRGSAGGKSEKTGKASGRAASKATPKAGPKRAKAGAKATSGKGAAAGRKAAGKPAKAGSKKPAGRRARV